MNDTVHDLKMPSFGADMATGTLVEWLVKEGDKITRGSVIAVIETHKGAIDLDIFEDALIEKLLLKEGQRVTVGTPIARLRSLSAESLTAPKPRNTENINNKSETTDNKKATENHITKTGFILATPAARNFAKKHQLSLHSIQSLNSKKIITLKMVKAKRADSTAAQTAVQQNKAEFDKEAMRQAISETVTRSKQQIPHYYLSQRLDITTLEQYLYNYNATTSAESRLLLAAPLLCAIARTLMKNNQLNGLYINDRYSPSSTVNLANAINLRGGGLVMPVIRNAQTLTPTMMMEQLKEQVDRARNGSLRISEISGASFTVTSIGERGTEQMFAVIYPPQVAIIALGSPHQEAMVIEGEMEIRSIIEASLAADHRVSDGHIGARLLTQLNKQLQNPEDLWIVKQ